MRASFHEDLDKISEQLVEMTRLAGSAMSRATTALLDADLHLAESVIASDEQIDELRRELDELSIDLLARQQPVATDLRMVVTAMRMSSDLERMGDLAPESVLQVDDHLIDEPVHVVPLLAGVSSERMVRDDELVRADLGRSGEHKSEL